MWNMLCYAWISRYGGANDNYEAVYDLAAIDVWPSESATVDLPPFTYLVLYGEHGRVSDIRELQHVRNLWVNNCYYNGGSYGAAVVEHANGTCQAVYCVDRSGLLVEIARLQKKDPWGTVGFLDVDGDAAPELVVSASDLYDGSGKETGVIFANGEKLPVKPVKVSPEAPQFVVLEINYAKNLVTSWSILKCTKVEKQDIPKELPVVLP